MAESIGPISKKQEMYINSEADVTLFGGAAGSGKSEIGIIDFLKHTDIKNFIGVVVRRTTPQLKGPGGLLTKAKRTFKKMYGQKASWKDKDGKFVFPAGTEVFFRHYENEAASENYQGIEANLIYVDEGTQFSLDMIQYLMSRMRNPSCESVKPHLKITCNPDADHFLRDWVDWYLQEDGRPDPAKDGVIRYFTFSDGRIVWADTIEQLVHDTGCGYDDALSFTFISATVADNPIVQKINPKYVSWLKGLKGVERERLLYGNWNVRESTSGLWKREWVKEISHQPEDHLIEKIVRAWDFAGSLPSETLPDPDYTVGVKLALMKDKTYVILDVVRFRARYGDVINRVIEIAGDDGFGVDVIIPQDPGAAGKAASSMAIREITAAGFYARSRPTSKSKVDRFRPFAAASEHGLISIVKGCCSDLDKKAHGDNSFFYKELEAFDGGRKGHDDCADSVGDAYMAVATRLNIPLFSPPDFSQRNPFRKS